MNQQGKYDEAIKAYDRAIEIDPQYVDAWIEKGNILYVRKKKYDEAAQAYDEAVKIDPQNASILIFKGCALDRQGKYDDAVKVYDRAISLGLNDASTWYSKGVALNNLDKYDDAIQAYDEAIKLDPDYSSAWCKKGNALYEQGKYDEAIKAYDRAIEIDPQMTPEACNGKGSALSGLGRYEEAVQCYDTAIEANPGAFFFGEMLADSWNGKGSALSELDRYGEAIQCFNTAIDLNPELSGALSGKVQALESASHGGLSQVASQQQTMPIATNGNPIITSDGEDIQPLLGTWHLPGGDIAISQEDLDLMGKNINSFYLKEITPRKVFVYALIKYHHMYKILLPPSAVESGIQDLSNKYNILNSTKSEIRAFWTEYMKLNFKGDSEFGTQQGILDDWNLYNIKVDTLRQSRIYGIQSPLVTDYVQWENLMHDMNEFDNNVIQRDFKSWIRREGYITELNARWAIGAADYAVWKSQISR